MKVLTFSLGVGPELFGFNDRHGTRWKISAIPLGGYVKFFGDETEASWKLITPILDRWKAQGREAVQFIADHMSNEEFRFSFLQLPDVRALMD